MSRAPVAWDVDFKSSPSRQQASEEISLFGEIKSSCVQGETGKRPPQSNRKVNTSTNGFPSSSTPILPLSLPDSGGERGSGSTLSLTNDDKGKRCVLPLISPSASEIPSPSRSSPWQMRERNGDDGSATEFCDTHAGRGRDGWIAGRRGGGPDRGDRKRTERGGNSSTSVRIKPLRGGGREGVVALREGGDGTGNAGTLSTKSFGTSGPPQPISEATVKESTLPFPTSLVPHPSGSSGVSVAPPTVLTITPTFVPYVDNSKTLTPHGTVRELQKNYEGPAKTAKGRAIQGELRKLANDYFGGAESCAPPEDDGRTIAQEGSTSDSSINRYARFDGSYLASAVPKRWREGPLDSAGRVFDASDRNLLCMDVQRPKSNRVEGGKISSSGGLQCVVGSADHGLRVFDTRTMKEIKNLYNKDYGHTEWVTACKYLRSGKILSAGMDSKLCLWNPVPCAGIAKCQNLLGHTASISQVEVNDSEIAVSASYDRTLRIWDCNGGGREVGCLAGHKAAVMQFAWNGTQIISGDRQGQAKIWDVTSAACVSTLSTKRGQISALGHLLHQDFGNWTMFGDQGGTLTVLDYRQGKAPVFQNVLHPSAALTLIKTTPDAPYVISCGADSRILVLDPRKNFESVFEWTDHKDYVYSLETFGSLVLSGGGNGWLLVHDVKTGKCCYGLGANTAAVRCMFVSPRQLVCAGDDGKASVYDY